jgi:hypothetical protein
MKGKIFNAQEVQSILSGNKTQFREVIKEIGKVKLNSGGAGLYFGKCPYEVGQKIFCKESFCLDPRGGILYKTLLLTHDLPKEYAPQWKPAQNMKQEHSRLTLQIKEITVERLSEISEEDAILEGVDYFSGTEPTLHSTEWHEPDSGWLNYEEDDYTCENAVESFTTLWNATHKKPEEKFEANPWVWVVSFEVINN